MFKTAIVWELFGDRVDSTVFFLSLPEFFPEATTLYAEGTCITPDVQACLSAHAETGPFLPGANTVWPESMKFGCKFSVTLTESLARLSEVHAEPELMSHVFIYRNEAPLLYWHDAFTEEAWVSGDISESRVSAVAKRWGWEYRALSNPANPALNADAHKPRAG